MVQKAPIVKTLPEIKRVKGELTYKDALKEALVQEMLRDRRVIFYGEDVADYGGAFKVTNSSTTHWLNLCVVEYTLK